MKPATIYDVAREAGVSHQTVTRFLNGFEGIRPTTRARVQAAIEELNYRPNGAARWLRSRQSNRIGILAHRMDLSGPGRIIAELAVPFARRPDPHDHPDYPALRRTLWERLRQAVLTHPASDFYRPG